MWGVRLRSAVGRSLRFQSLIIRFQSLRFQSLRFQSLHRLKALGGDSARNALQDVAFTWRRVSWPRHPPKVRFGYADGAGPCAMLARVDQAESRLSLLLLHSSLANPADSDMTACLETLPVSSGLQLPVGSTPQWSAG